MDKAVYLAEKYNLILLEDTAHSVDSYYKGKPLGSFGQFSTCSFHETKNISSGEGGMLVVNDENFIPRAEIIWEKGTNRSAFSRGEISKYEWVDVGSSYNPSDMIAAFLYAQLNHLEDIQQTRINIWHRYESNLKALANDGSIELPLINDYATNNGHVFYLITSSKSERNNLLKYLNSKKIQAVFHYLPLHKSPYYKDKYDGKPLLNTQKFADRLIRLPLFYELPLEIVDMICQKVIEFYEK